MEFFLPQNLQTQLISYDPTLKKLARTAKTASKSNKPKFPLGQPYDIIPTSVIKTSLVQDAVDLINGEPAQLRIHEFKRFEGTPEEREDYFRQSNTNNRDPILPGETLNFGEMVTYAILYHYESCWYAAWLPPKGQEGEYIYGYAYSYKNTDTARKMVPHHVKENLHNCNLVTYGRSEFITYQVQVTKEAIITGNSRNNWAIADISWNKGSNIRTAVTNFVKALKRTIPVWDDQHVGGVFQRLKDISWISLLDLDRMFDSKLDSTWKPSVENLFKIIDKAVHHSGYNFSTHRSYSKIRHIMCVSRGSRLIPFLNQLFI